MSLRYITYHEAITKSEKAITMVPHDVLSEELQDKLVKWNVKEDRYYFHDNGFYFFLYLSNGDRVDVLL
jgi:hypothetical protein